MDHGGWNIRTVLLKLTYHTPRQIGRYAGWKYFAIIQIIMADPRNTRPNFTEAVETAMNKNKEGWRVQDLPSEERERVYDKLYPGWGKNWASYFKATQGSSSASSWSRPSSWWEWSGRHQWKERQEQSWEKQEWHEQEEIKMVIQSFRQRTATIWNSERSSLLVTVLLRVDFFFTVSRFRRWTTLDATESEHHIPPDAHNTHIFLVFVLHCTHAHFAWPKSQVLCAQKSHFGCALSCLSWA